MEDEAGDQHVLSTEQLQEARANLERYFEIALQVVEQDAADAENVVDISPPHSTMKERSNVNLKN